MSANAKEWLEIKDKAETLKRRKAQAEGALAELMKRLLKEHGVKTVKEGEKLLEKLKAEADAKETEFADAVAAFRAIWGKELED